jgi:hypothetical protein
MRDPTPASEQPFALGLPLALGAEGASDAPGARNQPSWAEMHGGARPTPVPPDAKPLVRRRPARAMGA